MIFTFLSILIFNSCSEVNSTTDYVEIKIENSIDSLITKSITEEGVISENVQINVKSLLSKIDTTYSTPFKLDSSYIDKISKLSSLSSTLSNLEVQYLTFNLIRNEPTDWSTYSITSFIKIDSTRLMGTYNDYLETIDIGMIQESEAHINSKIELNETDYILLWSIRYSSYEACPYSSGTVIFGTFFNDNIAINTATLGEDSGGGDAPYWGSTFISSTINSELIISIKLDENGGEENEDTGEEIVEKPSKTFSLK